MSDYTETLHFLEENNVAIVLEPEDIIPKGNISSLATWDLLLANIAAKYLKSRELLRISKMMVQFFLIKQ